VAEFSGQIGHLEGIESPWGNAGGVVKTIEDVERMAHTGVGWIEDGSHVLGGKRLGNAWNPETEQFDRCVYNYDKSTVETTNALGMPGQGFDVAVEEVPKKVAISHTQDKKYILNVAPVSDDPASETVEMVRRGYAAGADAVLVNAGCPNVITYDGGRHELLSRSPSGLWKVLDALTQAELPKPVFIRISPQESFGHMAAICDVIEASGIVSAVFLPNTWPGYVPLNSNGQPILQVPGGMGGRSGPAMNAAAEEQLIWASIMLGSTKIDIVSSSSIMNAHTLRRRLHLGATAGAGTTFYYESENGWKEDTDRLLSELAA